MRKNDKIIFRSVNYIPRGKTFEVENLALKTSGFVIFANNYQDM